jgi:hypothetical protein
MTKVSRFGAPKKKGRMSRKLALGERELNNRRRFAHEIAERKRQRAEAAISDLQKTVQKLDLSIKDHLDSVWITDPSHFAFPIAARSLVARRNNLMATIAELCNQLGH